MSSQILNLKILSTDEKVVLYSLLIGILGGFLNALPPEFLGFSPTALGWIIPVTACSFIAITKFQKNTFPIWIWIPWITYTSLCFLNKSYPNAFQRLIMMHAALIIAVAFSALTPSNYFFDQFTKGIKWYFWLVFLIGILASKVASGEIAGTTGFAAGSITAALLATWFAATYSLGDKASLRYWVGLCLVPFLCNTRTGMIAVAITLPFTFAPYPLKNRALFIMFMVAAGALAFQTERIQSKMFYSGHGTYEDAFNGFLDLMTGNDETYTDFSTNGRKAISIALKDGLSQNYWTGNGANASELISVDIGGITHPHNDWLRIQYEFGMAGIVIFASTIILQIYHAFTKLKYIPRRFIPLFCISIGAFLPMVIFMTSDNIILYIAWFGNLQFAAMGLFYSYVEIYKSK